VNIVVWPWASAQRAPVMCRMALLLLLLLLVKISDHKFLFQGEISNVTLCIFSSWSEWEKAVNMMKDLFKTCSVYEGVPINPQPDLLPDVVGRNR